MMLRRGFLKMVGAVAALGVTKYAEPMVPVAPEYRDWIEDRGDFFILRVPDFKSFAGEVLNKPSLILLGRRAELRNTTVHGYTNLYVPQGGLVSESTFDGSSMKTARDRGTLWVQGESVTLEGCFFIGSGAAIQAGSAWISVIGRA